MKYKNIKTGYVLDTDCEVKGEHWEKLDVPSSLCEEKEPPKKKRTTKK